MQPTAEPHPYPILIEVTRSGRTESVHRGCICIVDTSGRILTGLGHADQPVYWRSTAKLHQALSWLIADPQNRFGIGEAERAILCSSHRGRVEQTELVASILRKIGCDQNALICGAQLPADLPAAAKLICSGQSPSALHHQCSGNHAGLLGLCRVLGSELENYAAIENPAQQKMIQLIAEFIGSAPAQIELGADGCGIPAYRTPLRQLALAYSRLIDPPGAWPIERTRACADLVRAVNTQPDLISGPGEIDAEMMRAFPGHAICKTGAEGVCAAAFAPSENHPFGLGIAIKIADGTGTRARDVALLAVLDQLNLGRPEQREALRHRVRREILSGPTRVVGEIRAVFDLPRIS